MRVSWLFICIPITLLRTLLLCWIHLVVSFYSLVPAFRNYCRQGNRTQQAYYCISQAGVPWEHLGLWRQRFGLGEVLYIHKHFASSTVCMSRSSGTECNFELLLAFLEMRKRVTFIWWFKRFIICAGCFREEVFSKFIKFVMINIISMFVGRNESQHNLITDIAGFFFWRLMRHTAWQLIV